MGVDLLQIFRAGFVQRWHTNPDLAHTNDRIDGHSARVARIILALHPDPSVDLLRAALIHDDGEHGVGDIKAPAKDADEILSTYLEGAERGHRMMLWGEDSELSQDCRAWLRFADRLDAYMWAAHHAPHVLTGDGWPEAKVALVRMSRELLDESPKLWANFCAMIDRMEVRHAAS